MCSAVSCSKGMSGPASVQIGVLELPGDAAGAAGAASSDTALCDFITSCTTSIFGQHAGTLRPALRWQQGRCYTQQLTRACSSAGVVGPNGFATNVDISGILRNAQTLFAPRTGSIRARLHALAMYALAQASPAVLASSCSWSNAPAVLRRYRQGDSPASLQVDAPDHRGLVRAQPPLHALAVQLLCCCCRKHQGRSPGYNIQHARQDVRLCHAGWHGACGAA